MTGPIATPKAAAANAAAAPRQQLGLMDTAHGRETLILQLWSMRQNLPEAEATALLDKLTPFLANELGRFGFDKCHATTAETLARFDAAVAGWNTAKRSGLPLPAPPLRVNNDRPHQTMNAVKPGQQFSTMNAEQKFRYRSDNLSGAGALVAFAVPIRILHGEERADKFIKDAGPVWQLMTAAAGRDKLTSGQPPTGRLQGRIVDVWSSTSRTAAKTTPSRAPIRPAQTPLNAGPSSATDRSRANASTPAPDVPEKTRSNGSQSDKLFPGLTHGEIDKAISETRPHGDLIELGEYGGASRNRKALGIAGSDGRQASLAKPPASPGATDGPAAHRQVLQASSEGAQAAHGAPRSVMKHVPGYNADHALTWLMPRTAHLGMDAFWKNSFKAMRAAGRSQATAREIHDIVADSIRCAGTLSKGQQNALIARLHDEMFGEFELKPDQMMTLPYAK